MTFCIHLYEPRGIGLQGAKTALFGLGVQKHRPAVQMVLLCTFDKSCKRHTAEAYEHQGRLPGGDGTRLGRMGLRQEGRGSKSHCIPGIAATSGITQMEVSHTGQLLSACACVY